MSGDAVLNWTLTRATARRVLAQLRHDPRTIVMMLAVPMAVVAVLDAILGMSLGLFASAFARSEFQAVQFMPAFVLPQALLCGLVVARADMTPVLRWLSDVLPLSYAVDAMQRISASASWTAAIGADIAIILAFTAAALVGGALTLRRQSR